MKTPKEITVNYLESVKWEIDEQVKRQVKHNCKTDTINKTSFKSLCIDKAIDVVKTSEGE